MTIEDLSTNYSGIPWLDYLKGIMSPQIELQSTEVVIVGTPSYFKQLSDILSRTSNRIMANYMMWRVAKNSIDQLGDRFRAISAEFFSKVTGRQKDPPRWKTCLHQAQYRLPLAVGALSIKIWFEDSSKNISTEMFENIRESLKEMLEQVRSG